MRSSGGEVCHRYATRLCQPLNNHMNQVGLNQVPGAQTNGLHGEGFAPLRQVGKIFLQLRQEMASVTDNYFNAYGCVDRRNGLVDLSCRLPGTGFSPGAPPPATPGFNGALCAVFVLSGTRGEPKNPECMLMAPSATGHKAYG